MGFALGDFHTFYGQAGALESFGHSFPVERVDCGIRDHQRPAGRFEM